MLISTQEQRDEEEVERNGSEEEEDEEQPILVGSLLVNVVGLKYYHGTVSDGEMVQLVREPTNPYDENAIRVLNIRGDQVGHVERGKAANLAPLLDNESALIEGIVPSGSRNTYKMPCQVFVFSKPSMSEAVRDHLEYSGERLSMPGEEREQNATRSRGRGRRRLESSDAGDSSGGGAASGGGGGGLKKTSIDDVFANLIQASGKRQTMEADGIIKRELKQHQKEALAWMIQRENSSSIPPFWEIQPPKGNKGTMYFNTLTNFACDQRPAPLRGGIFADDMGMGKTLTVLALIATNRPGAVLPPITDVADEPLEEGDKEKEKEKEEENSARSSKKRKVGDVGKQVAVAADDGPPKANGPRATLIVCPLSVLSNWVGQLEEHTEQGKLNLHLYHGASRAKKANALAGFDIVLTTYAIVAAEMKDRNGPLRKMHWLRLVLDEAHLIKSPSAQQTKCAVALNADRRWAVTGTPIQNGVKDLFSLMQFLHFEPLNEKTFWNRTIQRPLTSGQQCGFTRLQGLMSGISLRRTKETKINGRKLVDLPPKIVTVFPVELTTEDRNIYDKMERDGKELILKYISNGTMIKQFSFVLQIILRLRQLCDHSSLCPGFEEMLEAMKSNQSVPVASPELLQKMLVMLGDEFDCPICLSPPQSAIITKCCHVFCKRCIERTFSSDKEEWPCPMCRAALTSRDIYSSNVGEEKSDEEEEEGLGGCDVKPSGKINALISLLQKTREKDPRIKTVVFSQFSEMLKVIESPLTAAGFKFVKLVGNMSAKKREKAMEEFRSSAADSPSVFLLSLKAAGVGLNLVSASNVVLMDPWWNPAVEEQAMDRVHRLGQTRDVHVFRLVVSDSIEERILKMQEKKHAYAQIAMGKEATEKRQQLCFEEVRLLMKC